MAVYVCFVVFLLVVGYITASSVIMSRREKELSKRRAEIVALYVRRANLMPVFFSAARRTRPIPGDIYNRFVKARDRFKSAVKDHEIRDANALLDAVFAEFFKHYKECRLPLYIKTMEDYDKLMEKVYFSRRFYEEAHSEWKKTRESLLRYGIFAGNKLEFYISKAVKAVRKRVKGH